LSDTAASPVRGHPRQHRGKRQIPAQALAGLVAGFVDERRAARILAAAQPIERAFRAVERDRGAAALEGDSRRDEILVLFRESEVRGRGLPAPARDADAREAEAPPGPGAARFDEIAAHELVRRRDRKTAAAERHAGALLAHDDHPLRDRVGDRIAAAALEGPQQPRRLPRQVEPCRPLRSTPLLCCFNCH